MERDWTVRHLLVGFEHEVRRMCTDGVCGSEYGVTGPLFQAPSAHCRHCVFLAVKEDWKHRSQRPFPFD